MDRRKWLTIDELAEYLETGRTKLCRMAQDGETPTSSVCNQWRFDRVGIDQRMRGQKPTVHRMSAGETE